MVKFTRTDFTEALLAAKVKISMDGRRRRIPSHRFAARKDCQAMDNRMMERLWRSLKYECVYLTAFKTGSEARADIGAWISDDTEKRPHSSHGLMTLAEACDNTLPRPKAAA